MNYKHLHYFHQVAKLGGVLRASEQLHLSPQTVGADGILTSWGCSVILGLVSVD